MARPRGWRAWWTFAALAIAAGLAGGAWAWFRPPDPLARGRAAYGRGDWQEASARARLRLKDRADDPDALRLLARASARLGRDDLAQSLYLRLGSEDAGAEDFALLASGLARRGRDDQAMRLLERARTIDPDHPEALDALATLYARHDFLLAAEGLARRLADRPGWRARGEWALGRLRLDLNDPAGAAEAFGRLLRLDARAEGLDATPETIRKRLARALLRDGRPADTRAALRDVPPDRETDWLSSRAALQQGDLAGAKMLAERAGDFGRDEPTAPEPAPYLGSSRCADCHAAIYRREQSGHHARTFARGADLAALPLPDRAVPDPGDPLASQRLIRDGETIRVEARVGDQVAEGLLEYAFGSGQRAVTPLVRDGSGETREYRLTYYAGADGWDLTVRHPRDAGSLADHLGKPLIEDTVRGCFACHTTDARASQTRRGPEAADRGIGCERCHGPGGHHPSAVAAGLPDPAIARPRLADARRSVELCAQCNSPRAAPVTPEDPSAVRFQGTTLTWSRCYTESRGGLSCVTCHDPHADAETSPAYYEAICLDCHGPTEGSAPKGTPCPVNPSGDCLRCHMPKVPEVMPHTSYTDHHIRARR